MLLSHTPVFATWHVQVPIVMIPAHYTLYTLLQTTPTPVLPTKNGVCDIPAYDTTWYSSTPLLSRSRHTLSTSTTTPLPLPTCRGHSSQTRQHAPRMSVFPPPGLSRDRTLAYLKGASFHTSTRNPALDRLNKRAEVLAVKLTGTRGGLLAATPSNGVLSRDKLPCADTWPMAMPPLTTVERVDRETTKPALAALTPSLVIYWAAPAPHTARLRLRPRPVPYYSTLSFPLSVHRASLSKRPRRVRAQRASSPAAADGPRTGPGACFLARACTAGR